MNFMNRNFLYTLLILLSSCSVLQDNSGYSEIFGTLKNYALGSNINITEQFIEDFPYSFAIVQIGRSPEIRMVLLSAENNIYEWVSSDKIRIFTKRGKIIKTIGLDHDIEFQDIQSTNEILFSQIFKVNFFYPELYDITLKSDFEKIQNRILETSSYAQIGWKINNTYVLNNGRVSQSIQRIHPHFPEISMRFFIK